MTDYINVPLEPDRFAVVSFGKSGEFVKTTTLSLYAYPRNSNASFLSFSCDLSWKAAYYISQYTGIHSEGPVYAGQNSSGGFTGQLGAMAVLSRGIPNITKTTYPYLYVKVIGNTPENVHATIWNTTS
jgi:hypothetical protein